MIRGVLLINSNKNDCYTAVTGASNAKLTLRWQQPRDKSSATETAQKKRLKQDENIERKKKKANRSTANGRPPERTLTIQIYVELFDKVDRVNAWEHLFEISTGYIQLRVRCSISCPSIRDTERRHTVHNCQKVTNHYVYINIVFNRYINKKCQKIRTIQKKL